MARFEVVFGSEEIAKAMGYLILVRGLSPEQAAAFVQGLIEDMYEKEGNQFYIFREDAVGEEIFWLQKKYRTLFGQNVEINKIR
jgi:hypothetical protein